MKRFIEGEDRSQSRCYPSALMTTFGQGNPVRVVDAFVEELKLRDLGFEVPSRRVVSALLSARGQPSLSNATGPYPGATPGRISRSFSWLSVRDRPVATSRNAASFGLDHR